MTYGPLSRARIGKPCFIFGAKYLPDPLVCVYLTMRRPTENFWTFRTLWCLSVKMMKNIIALNFTEKPSFSKNLTIFLLSSSDAEIIISFITISYSNQYIIALRNFEFVYFANVISNFTWTLKEGRDFSCFDGKIDFSDFSCRFLSYVFRAPNFLSIVLTNFSAPFPAFLTEFMKTPLTWY